MIIVLVEHHRYDGSLRVGSHHVARELLAAGHEVIWVSHPRSAIHRLFGPFPPERRSHPDGVVEIVPRVLAPYVDLPGLGSRFWGKRWLSPRTVAPIVAEVERRAGCDLVWLSDFTMLPILDHLQARHVVLRFFDHLDQFRWMPRSIYDLARHYRPRASLAVASSRHLVERLRREGIETHYLPNGAHVRENPRSLLRAPLRTDRVVYVGAIETWFDLETVERWAEALPDVRFDLVGPRRAEIDSDLPNVHFPGPIPYDRLPETIGGAGCGLVPFTVDDLTLGVHPLKLYDYLMLGCPVLSSALPEVRPADEGVFVYRDAEEGLALLRDILDRDDFDREALQDLAIANGWGRRMETVFELLNEPREAA